MTKQEGKKQKHHCHISLFLLFLPESEENQRVRRIRNRQFILSGLTAEKGVHQFRFFLSTMRTPNFIVVCSCRYAFLLKWDPMCTPPFIVVRIGSYLNWNAFPTWQFWDSGGVKLESLCNFSIVVCQWTVNCLLGYACADNNRYSWGSTQTGVHPFLLKAFDLFANIFCAFTCTQDKKRATERGLKSQI